MAWLLLVIHEEYVTMKTGKKLLPAKKIPEIFSDEVKKSGFNITKVYSDLVVKMLSFHHKNKEGSFDKTIEIVLDYLSNIEGTELHLQNHDLYIQFKLDLMKTERLPLFPGYAVRDIDIRFKDYQFVRLILKSLGLLFLDLSDQAVVSPDLQGCRTLLHLEKVFIEKAAHAIFMMDKKSEFEQDEILAYFSSYNTLSSYFSAMLSETSFTGKVVSILRKIEEKNVALNALLYEKFKVKYTASQWDLLGDTFNPQIAHAALYV